MGPAQLVEAAGLEEARQAVVGSIIGRLILRIAPHVHCLVLQHLLLAKGCLSRRQLVAKASISQTLLLLLLLAQ